jgi:hypothetical protein
MSDNPFEALRLAPESGEEEVVRQAGLLRQRATDEAELDAIRQAVQALTGPEGARAWHALLTHPRPDYRSPALERLAATYRRPPAASAAPFPPLELKEVKGLLVEALEQELEPTPLPFEAVDAMEGAEEIDRQTGEAVWQALIADLRG